MWKITPGRYFNTGKLNLSIGSAKTYLGAEIWQAFADVNSKDCILRNDSIISVPGYTPQLTNQRCNEGGMGKWNGKLTS